MKDQKNDSKQAGEAGAAMASFSMSQAAADGRSSQVKRKILVVGKGSTFTPAVMDYAVNLAQRLGYDLIGMSLNPTLEQLGKFFSPYNLRLRSKFSQQAQAAWELVRPGLAQQGINSEHVVKFTEVAEAVKDLNHEVKRIDFVITDVGIKSEEITGEIPLPVFSISGYGGEEVMAQEQEASRRKLVGKTIALGLGSVAIYAAVFWNSGSRDAVLHQGRSLCGAAHCHGVPGLLCARDLCLVTYGRAWASKPPRRCSPGWPRSRLPESARGRRCASMLSSWCHSRA